MSKRWQREKKSIGWEHKVCTVWTQPLEHKYLKGKSKGERGEEGGGGEVIVRFLKLGKSRFRVSLAFLGFLVSRVYRFFSRFSSVSSSLFSPFLFSLAIYLIPIILLRLSLASLSWRYARVFPIPSSVTFSFSLPGEQGMQI